MLYTMKETRLGSPDGFALNYYNAGQTYDLPELLACYFLKNGWAVRAEKPQTMEEAVAELNAMLKGQAA